MNVKRSLREPSSPCAGGEERVEVKKSKEGSSPEKASVKLPAVSKKLLE